MNVVTRESRTTAARLGTTAQTWHVSGYHVARRLLRDTRLSLEPTELGPENARARRELQQALITEWEAQNDRIRTILTAAATEKFAELTAAGAPFNIKNDYAIPVSDRAFVEVLGLQPANVAQVRGWVMNNFTGETWHTAASLRGLVPFLTGVVNAKIEGGDDLLSGLLDRVDAKAWPRARLISALGWLLLGTGWDLIHPVVSVGTALILGNPDQYEHLRAHPHLLPDATDEVFRLFDPAPTLKKGDTVFGIGEPLYVGADIEVEGLTIHRGDIVYVSLAKANRDPSVFSEPDRYLITRPEQHIAWETPGEVFPSFVFLRPETEICLGTLFASGRPLRMVDPKDVDWLAEPQHLRAHSLMVDFA